MVAILKILLLISSRSFKKQDCMDSVCLFVLLCFFMGPGIRSMFPWKGGRPEQVVSGAWKKRHTHKSGTLSPADCFLRTKCLILQSVS